MGAVTEIITILSSQMEQFTIAEYIFSKIIDIGTGKLWDEIKKKLPVKSLECQLYDAIEASMISYSKLNDLDQIAPACEIVFGRWVQNGYLSESDIKEALSYLNSRYISTRNVEVWFGLFHKELCDENRDILYRWFMLKTVQKADDHYRLHDKQIMMKINRLLNVVEQNDETALKEAKHKYKRTLMEQIYQPIFDEKICLKDIYISLLGKLTEIDVLNEPLMHKSSVVDSTSYLWDWYDNAEEDILFLYGTPGCGKSSLVKMLAATLSAETDGLVVFIDLHRLLFIDEVTAFKVLEKYIDKNYPWFFDESLMGKRLLILDGLDEIRYKPYDNAKALVRGLCQKNWDISCSVIISGRTQIIEHVSDESSYSQLELLPLYFQQILYDTKLMENGEGQEQVKAELRTLYWDKLMTAFNAQLEIPINDEQFDELSDSPLLLFLVVWTLIHTGVEFKDLSSTADLYDAIFQHIYTRAYNRVLPNDSKNINVKEYKGYQQMLRYLGGTAFLYNGRAISAKEIYDYCKIMGETELCEEWIRTHKEDNPSKLVLLFFLREEQNKMNWEESEIEFIHKTFYEYLAALATLELLFKCEENTQETIYLLFHLLSHNSLLGMTLDFIAEIIETGNRKIGNEWGSILEV